MSHSRGPQTPPDTGAGLGMVLGLVLVALLVGAVLWVAFAGWGVAERDKSITPQSDPPRVATPRASVTGDSQSGFVIFQSNTKEGLQVEVAEWLRQTKTKSPKSLDKIHTNLGVLTHGPYTYTILIAD